ncbi:response regulator [Vannielia litorea]|uniref:Response regulator receiver domain-containing protein n=1 Tax=Vannielia litorea TaxID=1217970 RepID=A0A1N6ELW1_9RHOB|nr:response regulator [Vannielia litorea]SIN84042.1 Response regulator receiver domain-containing protein [Vannielia litorea]
MKVLIVDDDPVFRQAFEAVLRSQDIRELCVAESGAEALRIVNGRDDSFDCIFVDIQMPEMDGIELTSILKSLDRTGETQIVMVTGMYDRQYIDKAFMAGADDYITKPLEPIEFRARMSSIRRVHESRNQTAAMQSQLSEAASRQHQFDFEDPITPPDVNGLISYNALRNYLKAIGRPRFAMSQRVGFCVENAANIYVRTTDEEFLDIMADVAEVIVDTLKVHNMVLAYAGCGDFIAVTTAAPMVSADQLESMINGALEEYQETYLNNCFPIVRAGKPGRGSFFSRRNIDEAIEDTINSARARSIGSQFSARKSA